MEFPWMRTRDDDNMERALEALAEGDLERALDLAARLRKSRFTGAFEVEAQVHRARGEPEKAVQVLREGLALAPQVWLNWLLLGSTLSDLERWAEAEEAYGRARACPETDPDWVDYNRAILAHRRGDVARALETCPVSPEDAELRERVLLSRVPWLVDAGRHDEAEVVAREGLAREHQEEWCEETRGHLRMHLADLLSRLGRADEARGMVRSALAERPNLAQGRWLDAVLERLHAPPWPKRRFKVVMEGEWREPGGELDGQSFLRLCLVGAPTEPEAVDLVRAFEDERGRPELRVQSIRDLGPIPGEYAGVLGALGRIFYGSADD